MFCNNVRLFGRHCSLQRHVPIHDIVLRSKDIFDKFAEL